MMAASLGVYAANREKLLEVLLNFTIEKSNE